MTQLAIRWTGEPSEHARHRILACRREPLFHADWLRSLFIHFEVDPEALQREVPFELDLREGRVYLSLVAFTMRGMRPRFGGRLGAWLLKPIATHEFLNVRAYVKHDGEPGIHFLAEWLSNRLSVALGPATFGLPYRHGRLRYDHLTEPGKISGCVTNASGLGGALKYEGSLAADSAFQPCEPGTLDEFLLERYTAFTAKPCRSASALKHQTPSPPRSGGEGRGEVALNISPLPTPYVVGRGNQTCAFHGARVNLRPPSRGRRGFFRIWHPPWPQIPVPLQLSDTTLLTGAWPWFRDARFIGANFSPGVRDVWMGWPHRL